MQGYHYLLFVSLTPSIANCYLAPAGPALKRGSPTAGCSTSISHERPVKFFFPTKSPFEAKYEA